MLSPSEQEWLIDAGRGDVRGFFAELGITLPERQGVEAPIRCFANPTAHNHDDRKPSCSVNVLTGLWNCQACGEHGNPYKAAQRLGRNDRDAADLARRFGLFATLIKEAPVVPRGLPSEQQIGGWRHRLRNSPLILARLQQLRGWTPAAMIRLGLGWDGERITIPIRSIKPDGLGCVGLVRYLPGGKPKSLAWPGGKRDLFPTPELIGRQHPLFVVEGEPDAIAMWSLGLKATAVPGTGSWRPEWARRLKDRRVLVMTDCDRQGRQLARKIAHNLPQATVLDLEPCRDDGYDIGDLVRDAATEDGLRQVADWLTRTIA